MKFIMFPESYMNERHPHALVSINAVIPVKEQAEKKAGTKYELG